MKKILLLLMFLSLMVSPAHAFTETFFGEDFNPDPDPNNLHSHVLDLVNADLAHDRFFSYLNGVGTENFEFFAAGLVTSLQADFGVAGVANIVGGGNSAINNFDGLGRFAVSGNKYFETNATATGTFTISFTHPIAAFGFYGTDIGDLNGQLTVTLSGGSANSYNISNAAAVLSGSALYWAIIDTDNPFTSITFKNTASGGDTFGFDDFSIGTVSQVRDTPVPLPSSLLFLTTGMLFLIRRKK
ncbi:MAG: hypothetical protein DRH03_00260 [Deltaproteobacteria bacterium]|nr:MAG: hypothetical protein DRH03_00260 [Deltaproteobacteria bacterium]